MGGQVGNERLLSGVGKEVQVSALGERKIQLPLGFLFDMGKVMGYMGNTMSALSKVAKASGSHEVLPAVISVIRTAVSGDLLHAAVVSKPALGLLAGTVVMAATVAGLGRWTGGEEGEQEKDVKIQEEEWEWESPEEDRRMDQRIAGFCRRGRHSYKKHVIEEEEKPAEKREEKERSVASSVVPSGAHHLKSVAAIELKAAPPSCYLSTLRLRFDQRLLRLCNNGKRSEEAVINSDAALRAWLQETDKEGKTLLAMLEEEKGRRASALKLQAAFRGHRERQAVKELKELKVGLPTPASPTPTVSYVASPSPTPTVLYVPPPSPAPARQRRNYAKPWLARGKASTLRQGAEERRRKLVERNKAREAGWRR